MVQVIPIVISIIAVCFTGTSLYFQYFHRPRRIRAIAMPMMINGRARFGICNHGKESIYITGVAIDYSRRCKDGGTMYLSLGEVNAKTAVISPGIIVEFSYSLTAPPIDFVIDAPQILNKLGQTEKIVEIKVNVQFAFPDGTVFSKSFVAGHFSICENAQSHSLYALNMDLLKHAMKVSEI